MNSISFYQKALLVQNNSVEFCFSAFLEHAQNTPKQREPARKAPRDIPKIKLRKSALLCFTELSVLCSDFNHFENFIEEFVN